MYRDHPRGCGENTIPSLRMIMSQGSPPRMRGKLHLSPKLFKYIGITPADAGKTRLPCGRHHLCPDHPRGCGENLQQISKGRNSGGSPPRMRGKRSCGGIASIIFGITPADAGKTLQFQMRICQRRDHPRGCGENKYWGYKMYVADGSPPRMRGKPYVLQ